MKRLNTMTSIVEDSEHRHGGFWDILALGINRCTGLHSNRPLCQHQFRYLENNLVTRKGQHLCRWWSGRQCNTKRGSSIKAVYRRDAACCLFLLWLTGVKWVQPAEQLICASCQTRDGNQEETTRTDATWNRSAQRMSSQFKWIPHPKSAVFNVEMSRGHLDRIGGCVREKTARFNHTARTC